MEVSNAGLPPSRATTLTALCSAALLTAWTLAARVQTLGGRRMMDASGHVADDALVYLQVARNVAHGAGSTFSGAMPTNGYQPLWLAMLVPFARAFGERVSLMRAALVLFGVCLFGAMVLAARVVTRAGSAHGYAAVLCLGIGIGATGTWLSEAALAAFS